MSAAAMRWELLTCRRRVLESASDWARGATLTHRGPALLLRLKELSEKVPLKWRAAWLRKAKSVAVSKNLYDKYSSP